MFISFEGADGCGKTTQLNLLAQWLKSQDKEVLTTRQPGGSELGQKIREILLDYDGEVSSQCESFLFLADRAQHVDLTIRPALEKGIVVLCDRYADSTVAYQGYGRQIDLKRINMLNDIATGGLKPDLTIVFDIDVETSQARVGQNKDRLEAAGVEFHNRVRNGYLELANGEPERVKVINSNDTIENIHEKVLSEVRNLLT